MATKDYLEHNAPFLNWLDGELNERGWDDAEVARRGDFSATTLTNIRKGRRKPGIKLANGLAVAFGLDPNFVSAKAGLVPDYTRMDNEKDEKDIQRIRRFFSQMEPATRDNYIAVGETLARQDQKRRTTDEARTRPAKART
jgi:transcriptional regulator with XRE-family HTH domain